MALVSRRPHQGLIHHTDQGATYTHVAYQHRLAEHGIAASMSRKGNCYDNAVAESFFSTLKNELVHERDYHTREEARAEIFEFIEVFYNRQRPHQTLDYVSPEQFEPRTLSPFGGVSGIGGSSACPLHASSCLDHAPSSLSTRQAWRHP